MAISGLALGDFKGDINDNLNLIMVKFAKYHQYTIDVKT